MIDFRYHLVSIIAVFLALAIGIVVGANALQPTTTSILRGEATRVSQANKTLLQDVKNLTGENSVDQRLVEAASGKLLDHLLTGQSVVLVTAPGADSSTITGLTSRIEQAGGKVTGLVSLQSSFFDFSHSTAAKLTQLAQTLAPNLGVTLSGQSLSTSTSGQAAAAQVIAAALVTKTPPGVSTTQSQQVLGLFGNDNYLQVTDLADGDATAPAPASLAIVVPPASPPTGSTAAAANEALIIMAQQLGAASRGAVLAGTVAGSGSGSAISAAAGTAKVSTVDYADQPVGQIITVWALAELAAGHPAASYGVVPGTVPSPAPISSVTPTAAATRQAKKTTK